MVCAKKTGDQRIRHGHLLGRCRVLSPWPLFFDQGLQTQLPRQLKQSVGKHLLQRNPGGRRHPCIKHNHRRVQA